MVKTKSPRTSDESEPAAKIAKIQRKVGRVVHQELSIPTRETRTGTVLCCGKNEVGQLGLGEDVFEKTRPAAIPGAVDAVAISAGGMHSLYLNNKGEVYSFGCNDEGALGRDTSEEGSEYEILKVDLPSDAQAVRITTGDSHSACLLEDGRVLAWGSFRDSHGNMGLTLEGNKRFPVEVVPGKKFASIASGADHLVMLTTDGKVYTVGCAEQGQLGRISARSSGGESRRGKKELLKPDLVHMKAGLSCDAIWATTYCTFAKERGKDHIYAFGLNNYAQLAIKSKKKLDLSFTAIITTVNDAASISGGQHHTLVLANDGSCHAIGREDYGRLGLGKGEDVTELTHIPSLDGKNVVQLICGEATSFARTKDGQVYAWGIGSNHQLGVGSEDDVYEPTLLTGQQVKDKEVLDVNSGGQHSLFLVSSEPAAKPNNSTETAEKKPAETSNVREKTDKKKPAQTKNANEDSDDKKKPAQTNNSTESADKKKPTKAAPKRK